MSTENASVAPGFESPSGDRGRRFLKALMSTGTIFVILLILWALGMVSGSTMGGFIHLLLILAVVVVLVRIIQGRRPI